MSDGNNWSSSRPSDSGLPANNPFLESSAANRFPALESPSIYPSTWLPSSSPQFQQQSYSIPQQYPGSSIQVQQPQLSTSWPGELSRYGMSQLQPTGYTSPGQQYDQGSSYSGLPAPTQYAGYSQQPSPTSLPQYQYYQQGVLDQFDPYGRQTYGGGPVGTLPLASPGLGPSGQQHPRQFIQSHRIELGSWDDVTWKQALLTFEELKRSWENRRAEFQRQLIGGHYLTSEETARLDGLMRNAESNIDIVVASLVQMKEVYSGYKHSLDGASKHRVREALNAGLQGLPEWP